MSRSRLRMTSFPSHRQREALSCGGDDNPNADKIPAAASRSVGGLPPPSVTGNCRRETSGQMARLRLALAPGFLPSALDAAAVAATSPLCARQWPLATELR